MAEQRKPDQPNMDGYLEFKNRAQSGDQIEREATRAFMDNFFKDKPAIVHYQDALMVQRSLDRDGLQQDHAQRAIKTGQKMAELRQGNEVASENELFFQARAKVDREHRSEMLERHEPDDDRFHENRNFDRPRGGGRDR